jgi:hypothetical protein
MSKFNLSEAAKDILLGEDSKSIQASTTSGKRPEGGRLSTSVGYGTNDAGKIGQSPNSTKDELPAYTKGVPTATPPGATPPVGSEPMKKLKPQPQNDKNGDQPDVQGGEDSYETIRDRKKGSMPKQTMQTNAGATAPYCPEEVESDEEVIYEAEEEGHEDAAQDKKMIKKMIKKETMKEKMKEDIDALMSGENLSEEFVAKASTIFEAAVIARAEEVIAEAEEHLIEQFESAVEEIKEDLAAKVDSYLNYMVEEWIKDNEIAIEKGLRAEIVDKWLHI